MLNLKSDRILEDTDNIKNNIEKIKPMDLVNEAINYSLKKANIKKLNDDKEETLNLIYNKTIKNYLNYLRTFSINEAEQKIKIDLEENKKNIKSLLIKSENEINEYKAKYLNSIEENNNLKDKIYSLQNYNRELIKNIHIYQTNFEKLQKNYENISKQKTLFEEIMQSYPGKNPSEIIKELQNMKDGIFQMMNDYQNISMKLYEIKESQKNSDKEYKASIQKLSFENKILKEEKNAMDYQYYYKINNLEQSIADNESKVKENQYLKNVLFHIYNLLFKEFALNRNIKIDKKYLHIKESDFNANFFYDNEIKNYIIMMIKTMNPITYDIIFRETMGYLNMILRIYLPNKMELRFQPVKAFKEIKDFIDIKMGIIDNNKKIIENLKKEIEKKDNEIFQIKQDMEALNKEYNSYKKIVEKEFEKTNKIIFQLKNNKEKKNSFIAQDNKKNLSFTQKKIEKKEKILLDNSEIDTNINSYKYKLRDMAFRKTKSRSINYKTMIDNNNPINKNILKNNTIQTFNDTNMCKTLENKNKNEQIMNDFLYIRKSNNRDKIIKKNGNQEIIDNFNNIKFLINETNRLFLYQPKMNSTQNKIIKKDRQNFLKTRVIKDYNELTLNDETKINKRIIKKINNLIISSKI